MPEAQEWDDARTLIFEFITTRKCKAAAVEGGSSLVAGEEGEPPVKTEGMLIAIWDRPNTMNEWNELIKTIK